MDREREVARLFAQARATAGALPRQRRRIGGSHELYREKGENFRSVCVQVSEDEFQIDTHDMGRATKEFRGDSDYEFWTIVPRMAWPKLLAALATEVGADGWATNPESWRPMPARAQATLLLAVAKVLFADDFRATDRLGDICEKHGVESRGGSWV
jgi:hypothetical protein